MYTAYCQGIDIHYQRQGSGVPVLLLHGLGSSSADWCFQLEALKDDFDVIVPDLPLHGRSGGLPSAFDLPYCADIMAEFLTVLGLEKICVVGVSMGGMIGFEMAIRHPARLSKLCVVNALAECKPRLIQEWWMLWSRRLLLRYASIKTIATLMAKQLLPHDPALRATAIERWANNNREAYLAAFEALVDWTVTDKLSSVRCPLMMMASEFDYTRKGAKKAVSHLYPDGEYVCLSGCHHLAPLEAPQQFNQTLLAWLYASY